jgi:Pyridoxamine 5''-phosphate oxidase.
MVNPMNQAVLTPEMKEVLTQSPFIALTSVSKAGQPHLIVVGKVKEIVVDHVLVFGVYQMNKTRQNLAETGLLQVAAVSGKSGYRFSGSASFSETEIRCSVTEVEPLL